VTPDRADLFIRHARVWSEGAVRGGIDAVAVAAGRIVAVGPATALEPWIGSATRVVDARGATLTPGLVDAHIHLVEWAGSLDELSLREAASREEVGRLLAGFAAARPGAGWLVGRGWDENAWSAPPHRSVLDAVCPGRPVLLHSHDFHAVWLNGEALRRAGITRVTPDPEGGRIEREPQGEATGVLREHAVRLVASLARVEDDAADLQRLRRAAARLLAWGVTGVQNFEAARAHRLLRALASSEGPRVRVLAHLHHSGLEPARELGLESGLGDEWFRVGALKLFADGTLGSRTAALNEPYAGTDDRGMELIAPDALREVVARATSARLSVAIHAIGDRAVQNALDAIEGAGTARAGLAMPPRLEHVQLARTADVPRFAALGVTASLQPSHAVADRPLVERAWPDRVSRAYPARALLESGARLAFGADAPVESPDPSLGLHAAVTRRSPNGETAGWLAAQTVSLDAALTAYTEGPARAAGLWPRAGRIAPGLPADLVLWEADLHALETSRLATVRPSITVQDGIVVHESGPGAGGKPELRAAEMSS
jgi:predicted amidohydrolase YtcJ